MSVYPIYLVLGSDGTIGAYFDKTIMKVDLAQNFQAGHPARQVFELQQTLSVTYAPTSDFAMYTIGVCAECEMKQKAAGAK